MTDAPGTGKPAHPGDDVVRRHAARLVNHDQPTLAHDALACQIGRPGTGVGIPAPDPRRGTLAPPLTPEV